LRILPKNLKYYRRINMSFPHVVSLASEAIYREYENKPCPIGTLGMDAFGSLYRLCKAGAAITIGGYPGPVANANVCADGVTGDLSTCDLYSDTASVGDLVIRIDDTNTAAARPVDFFEGGHAFFYGANTTERQARRVVSSTIGTSASLYITLDAPLTVAITDGAVDVFPSQYSNCVNPQAEAAGYETFVAFPLMPSITSGYYFWGLTRGPCMGHYHSTWPGAGAVDKDVYFYQNGSIDSVENVTGSFGSVSPQRAGYLIPCNTSDYGSTFFFLQLE
jgi:hypothetical protein